MTLTVSDVMTPDPVIVTPEDTIQEVAEQMLENQVSAPPVVQNERVVGIITESDIFKFIVSSWMVGAFVLRTASGAARATGDLQFKPAFATGENRPRAAPVGR